MSFSSLYMSMTTWSRTTAGESWEIKLTVQALAIWVANSWTFSEDEGPRLCTHTLREGWLGLDTDGWCFLQKSMGIMCKRCNQDEAEPYNRLPLCDCSKIDHQTPRCRGISRRRSAPTLLHLGARRTGWDFYLLREKIMSIVLCVFRERCLEVIQLAIWSVPVWKIARSSSIHADGLKH